MRQRIRSLLVVLLFSIFLLSHCKQDQKIVSQVVQENADPIKDAQDKNKFEQLTFFININAPIESVYQTVIDKDKYSDWVSAFSSNTYFKGNWIEGDTINFLTDMDNGKQLGMISLIKDLVPKQLISLEHIGMIKDGKEIMESEEVNSFKGATEKYSFSSNGQITTMVVDTDVFIETSTFFQEAWPKALARIKELSEKK